MPWCPVCKNEYKEGYTHCNDCDVDLVDSLEEGPRALIAGAEYDMNRMAELLQAKDVECFVRPGQRKDEFELYVTEEHAERATAYLQSYVQAMMPVSYTHLDVYKRQSSHCVSHLSVRASVSKAVQRAAVMHRSFRWKI